MSQVGHEIMLGQVALPITSFWNRSPLERQMDIQNQKKQNTYQQEVSKSSATQQEEVVYLDPPKNPYIPIISPRHAFLISSPQSTHEK